MCLAPGGNGDCEFCVYCVCCVCVAGVCVAGVCVSLPALCVQHSSPPPSLSVSAVWLHCSLCAPLPSLSSISMFPSACKCMLLAYLLHLRCPTASSEVSVSVSIIRLLCAAAVQLCCLCRYVYLSLAVTLARGWSVMALLVWSPFSLFFRSLCVCRCGVAVCVSCAVGMLYCFFSHNIVCLHCLCSGDV